jgi:SEC-C motif-containing protein
MQKHNFKLGVNSPCPCGSGNKYKKCCQPFHKGSFAKTSLELMRSRYVAYIISNSNYIIKTTHINNPDFTIDTSKWSDDILEFCTHSSFEKLDILEYIDGKEESFVKFKVKLTINGKDESFVEKSKFLKNKNGMWQYHSGEFNE